MGEFNKVLKSLRLSMGITQDDLAKTLNISRSAVGMYEKGDREPDYETLEAIADFFNVDIDYLLGRTRKTTLVPHTIAAHHDGDWTQEELDEIEQFKKYILSKRKK